jgi:hypothetical protein
VFQKGHFFQKHPYPLQSKNKKLIKKLLLNIKNKWGWINRKRKKEKKTIFFG